MKFKKIAIISDTHMHLSDMAFDTICGKFNEEQIYDYQIFTQNKNITQKFQEQKEKLQHNNPDLIVHAGDVGYQSIIDTLESIATTKVVNGNCDFESYKTLEGESKNFEFFEFADIKIAIAHVPYDLEKFVKGNFLNKPKVPKNTKPNLMIHGHTHEAYVEQKKDGTIYICPGSATMGRYGSPNSIAFVYIYNKEIIATQLIKV